MLGDRSSLRILSFLFSSFLPAFLFFSFLFFYCLLLVFFLLSLALVYYYLLYYTTLLINFILDFTLFLFYFTLFLIFNSIDLLHDLIAVQRPHYDGQTTARDYTIATKHSSSRGCMG